MISKTRMDNQHTNSKYTHQAYQSCFTLSPRLRQIIPYVRDCAVCNLCIQLSTHTHKPKRRYRYCQQQTTGSLWVCHPCFMPLPTTSLGYPEALILKLCSIHARIPYQQALDAEGARSVMMNHASFALIRMNGCHLSLTIRLKSLGE